WRVRGRDHSQNARSLHRRRRVAFQHLSFRNSALDRHSVRELLARIIRGVFGGARDLQASVHAIDRLANYVVHISKVLSDLDTARLRSSTLKLFAPRGCAP